MPNLPFFLAASNANLKFGGPLKWKKRLVKEVSFLLPLTEVMKIVRDSVENKPASLVAVSLGKAHTVMPSSLCGDRWRSRTLPGYNCEDAQPACRKGDSWVPTNGSLPWWWGDQSFMTSLN